MGGTYHVVCHECPVEGMFDERTDAVETVDAHERETGHRLSVLDISPTATRNH